MNIHRWPDEARVVLPMPTGSAVALLTGWHGGQVVTVRLVEEDLLGHVVGGLDAPQTTHRPRLPRATVSGNAIGSLRVPRGLVFDTRKHLKDSDEFHPVAALVAEFAFQPTSELHGV